MHETPPASSKQDRVPPPLPPPFVEPLVRQYSVAPIVADGTVHCAATHRHCSFLLLGVPGVLDERDTSRSPCSWCPVRWLGGVNSPH